MYKVLQETPFQGQFKEESKDTYSRSRTGLIKKILNSNQTLHCLEPKVYNVNVNVSRILYVSLFQHYVFLFLYLCLGLSIFIKIIFFYSISLPFLMSFSFYFSLSFRPLSFQVSLSKQVYLSIRNFNFCHALSQ